MTLKEENKEEDYGQDSTVSPLSLFFLKYDEFAAQVVAAENKKKSEQKLNRLTN